MNYTFRSYKGKFPQLGQRVYIDPCAILVGDIQLADDTSIWPMVVARGDVHHIQIGARSNIQDGTVLHVTSRRVGQLNCHPLHIGEDVTVGHKAILHGCTIGNRVLVGMGAIILDGAVIEDEVMIGAGSLVPPGKQLKSGFLYMGNPAKQARPLKPVEIAFLKTSADNYVRLKDEYLQETL
ncbi:MAG: gamma carbonic anhydrase family protein [Aeromonas sp.]